MAARGYRHTWRLRSRGSTAIISTGQHNRLESCLVLKTKEVRCGYVWLRQRFLFCTVIALPRPAERSRALQCMRAPECTGVQLFGL